MKSRHLGVGLEISFPYSVYCSLIQECHLKKSKLSNLSPISETGLRQHCGLLVACSILFVRGNISNNIPDYNLSSKHLMWKRRPIFLPKKKLENLSGMTLSQVHIGLFGKPRLLSTTLSWAWFWKKSGQEVVYVVHETNKQRSDQQSSRLYSI